MAIFPYPPVSPIFLPFGYDNFDALVGRLKRSAIDAYICGNGTFRIVGDHYENRMSTSRWLTRPDECGVGEVVPLHAGEDWGDADDVAEEFTVEIDRIRRRVDGLVDKWRDLPDPRKIQEEVDEWQRIFAALNSSAPDGGDDPVVRNVGRLQDKVNGDAEHKTAPELWPEITIARPDATTGAITGAILSGEPVPGAALEGSTARAFKKYVDRLYVAVSACRDTALVTGAAMAAQQGLWEAARRDCAQILSHTADALDEIARGEPSAELGAVFGAASIVFSAVGLFTGGSATVVVTSLGVALSLVGSASSDSRESRFVVNCSTALDFMDKLLNNSEVGLAGRIEQEEKNIRKNIVDNTAEIDENRSVFDPRPGPIESTDGLNRPHSSVTDSIYSLMSDITDGLGWVGNHARGSALSVGGMDRPAPWVHGQRCLVERDHAIGIGRTGPTEEFQGLADLLATLLLELSWEVAQGEKNLRAAMDMLDQANADTHARLRVTASDFAAGYHGDGL